MQFRWWALAGVAFAPFVFADARAETKVSLSSGADYSSGKYGGDVSTDVFSVPLSVRIARGDWSLRASIPYLSIDGPADVADDNNGSAIGPTSRNVSGFSDTTLSLTRSFRNIGGSDFFIDATGRIRLPTGDENRGLGVGATDYTALAQAGVAARHSSAYLSLGRRFLGDTKQFERQDGWQAALGGWISVRSDTRIGASYTWREPSIAGLDDPKEISGFVSHRMSDAWRLSLNAGAGLSDSSPDYRVGIHVTWSPDWFSEQ